MRILIIEDEKSLSDAICEGLRDNYFIVDQAFDGSEGLSKIEVEEAYDILIIDIMLPKIDGVTLLKNIREKGYKMPVLMLTAKSDIDDKVESLSLGADDYLTKPFDFRELLARVRALLRREKDDKKTLIEIYDLTIDTNKNIVKRGGKVINLTKKEYQILLYLVINRGRVVSKVELENHLWDENASLWSDTIRSHIKNLRKKIDNDFEKKIDKNYSRYRI